MNMNESSFALTIEEIEKLNMQIERFKNNYKEVLNEDIMFLDIKDVMEITGWSKHTVEALFNNPSFPCTDLGKNKLVLKFAFINFFMERRCKGESWYTS